MRMILEGIEGMGDSKELTYTVPGDTPPNNLYLLLADCASSSNGSQRLGFMT